MLIYKALTTRTAADHKIIYLPLHIAEPFTKEAILVAKFTL
jgi:hypothetical protein